MPPSSSTSGIGPLSEQIIGKEKAIPSRRVTGKFSQLEAKQRFQH